jgi:hypothetical protein
MIPRKKSRRKSLETRAALRQQIIEQMDFILEILETHDRTIGHDGDPRPAIISIIRDIAATPPTIPKGRYDAVATAAKKLWLAIRGLPEYTRLEPVLERAIAESEASRKIVRMNLRRAHLASRLTYNFILDNGFGVPTLSGDKKYVLLTALVVEVATGRPCSKSTAARACKQYFEDLKAEASEPDNPWPYSPKGRTPKQKADPKDEVAELVTRDIAKHSRQLIKAERYYPPLEELLDQLLG